MDMFLNAVKYCEDGLSRAIANNDSPVVIQAWKDELSKWKYKTGHYYVTCKNPM